MRLVQTIDEIEYPESDGKPIGETDLHRDWMSLILDILRYRYWGQKVYVGSNLLVYYKEGAPTDKTPDTLTLDRGESRRQT